VTTRFTSERDGNASALAPALPSPTKVQSAQRHKAEGRKNRAKNHCNGYRRPPALRSINPSPRQWLRSPSRSFSSRSASRSISRSTRQLKEVYLFGCDSLKSEPPVGIHHQP